MAQNYAGGSIAVAQEFEQYDFDEAVTLGTSFANILLIDAMKIRDSVIQIINKGTGSEIASYKVFATAKKGVKLSTALPEVEDHWVNLKSTGTYDHTVDVDIPASVAATGTVTLASAIATDTVTVNGLVYTAVAGAKADNTEFSIDTSDTAAATDLADSITNDARTPVTVPTIDVTAIGASAVVTITASVTGDLGNTIDLASSNGTRLATSGAFLTGGLFSKAFETLSNTWRYVIISAKSATGTPTLKIWHRGEN